MIARIVRILTAVAISLALLPGCNATPKPDGNGSSVKKPKTKEITLVEEETVRQRGPAVVEIGD